MKRPLILVFLLFAAVCAAGFSLYRETGPENGSDGTVLTREGQVRTVSGVVVSFEERDGYALLILKKASVRLADREVRIGRIRATLDKASPLLRAGQPVTIRGKLRRSAKPSNPGQFSEEHFDRLHHIHARMTRAQVISAGPSRHVLPELIASLRRALLRRLRAVYPEDVQEVLGAMLLGRKEFLSEETSFRYEAGGVSHMLVISSMHISILSMGIFGLLRRLKASLQASVLTGGAVLILFVSLTGFSVSALRALIVYVISMLAKWNGRSYDRWNAASFAAIVILAGDPCYITCSSFQLSFAAVFLCILSSDKGKIGGGVILQLGLLPLIAWHFYEVPYLALPVNLLLLPFLPCILVTGAAGLLLGGAAVWPAVLLVRGYDFLLSFITRVPDRMAAAGKWKCPLRMVWVTGRPAGAQLILYGILFAVFLFLREILRDKKRKILAYFLIPLMLFVMRPVRQDGLRLTFLDVGQGDGTVIEADGCTVMVDGGSSDVPGAGQYRIEPFLLSQGIAHLDLIAVTHADADHYSGILEILTMIATHRTAITADCLLLPAVAGTLREEEGYQALIAAAQRAGIPVRYGKAGDGITAGNMKIRVLGPDAPDRQKEAEANAQCLILSVSYGEFDALLTGDVCGEGEKKLTETVRQEGKTYEVLKVAHHGARSSTPEEFLQAVRPSFAILSCGRGNRYGHPHKEVMERAEAMGCEIRRTDREGCITVSVSSGIRGFLR